MLYVIDCHKSHKHERTLPNGHINVGTRDRPRFQRIIDEDIHSYCSNIHYLYYIQFILPEIVKIQIRSTIYRDRLYRKPFCYRGGKI